MASWPLPTTTYCWGGMTPIAPLITNFLREHVPVERGYSPHRCETYAHAFRLLFVFANQRLGIKPSQLCLEQIDAALMVGLALENLSLQGTPSICVHGKGRKERCLPLWKETAADLRA